MKKYSSLTLACAILFGGFVSAHADTILVLPRALYPRGAGVGLLGGRGEASTEVLSGSARLRAAGRVTVRVAPR